MKYFKNIFCDKREVYIDMLEKEELRISIYNI